MKKITLRDLFLKELSTINSEMATQIRMAIKSPDVAELLNVVIANGLGVKQVIKESVFDNAIDFLISSVHRDIDNSSLKEEEKNNEKNNVSSLFQILAGNGKNI
ncbi:MAG: hypothetical protein E7097_09065 [Bacteroides sp.]|nr:hypothetical protein [Bacteroides sp.]